MGDQSTPALALPDYETVALVLQGGGALGSYQAGVYQGLHESGVRPNWYAGISIGAINVALIAGNPPERRIARLNEFWETVCRPNGPSQAILDLQALVNVLPGADEFRAAANALSATRTLFEGQQGFFNPRFPPPWLQPPGTPAAVRPMRARDRRGSASRGCRSRRNCRCAR